MQNLRFVTLVIELLLFSSFIYVLVAWFRKEYEQQRPELQWIKIAGLLFILLHLGAAAFWPMPSLLCFIVGNLLLLVSASVFLSAFLQFKNDPPAVAFSGQLVTGLRTTGPYRWIRHPFYTSYMLGWLGGTLATGCWWLIISLVIMGFIYVKAAKEEETQWLNSPQSSQYLQYKNNTGMFLPKIIR